MDLAQGIADHAGGVEHIGCAQKAGLLLGFIGRLEQINDCLGNPEVSRRHQDQHAVVEVLESGHFPKGIDLIDTGVGPRVRQHHETGVDQQADAVSHAEIVPYCRRRADLGRNRSNELPEIERGGPSRTSSGYRGRRCRGEARAAATLRCEVLTQRLGGGHAGIAGEAGGIVCEQSAGDLGCAPAARGQLRNT
jgi:hypothetical protein